MIRTLTCIECPVGCEITAETENGEVKSVRGNSCPRGRMYAESEVVCPRRVVTSAVRAENGETENGRVYTRGGRVLEGTLQLCNASGHVTGS